MTTTSSMPNPDDVNRTHKLLVDRGDAADFDEAAAQHEEWVLQVDIARGITLSPLLEAMLVTILNTGSRAFGQVRVRFEEDETIETAWAAATVSGTVGRYSAQRVSELNSEHPTIALVGKRSSTGSIVVHPFTRGWCAGVTNDPDQISDGEFDVTIAAVLAASMGVAEAFEHKLGSISAGRRTIGVSLWRPDLHHADPQATGDPIAYLPSAYWLCGLGHLGQAYAWTIGLLPYPDRSKVTVMLQDYDTIVKANISTSMLATAEDIDRLKTRVVDQRLRELGFSTRICERAFDERTIRRDEEPLLALAGFDKAEPRRRLSGAGFDLAVDAGLGSTPTDYCEIALHAFRPGDDSSTAFPDSPPTDPVPDQIGYQRLQEQLEAAGETATAARCGILDLAGRAPAVAFVGSSAAALALAEALRLLNGGQSARMMDFSLRSPHLSVLVSDATPPAPTFGWIHADASVSD